MNLRSHLLNVLEVNVQTGVIRNKHSGQLVTGCDSYGYIQVSCGTVNGKRLMMKAHQVVFVVEHGELPKCSIDHIDRDKLNNCIDNLRPASAQLQARNKEQRGVSYRTGQGRPYFRATIRRDDKTQIERIFRNGLDAWAWRKSQENRLWAHVG